MSMSMSMDHPERASRVVVRETIDKAIQGSVEFPTTIEIGKVKIAVSDVAASVQSFKTQLYLIQKSASYWPSIELDYSRASNNLGVVLVPIDLRDGTSDFLSGEDPTYQEIMYGNAQSKAAHMAARAGLLVRDVEPEEAKEGFVSVLSEFLSRRTKRPVEDGYAEPPSDDFTVTTDTEGVEVLVAKGYFISTRQGFGISTPAKRRLNWGPYTFGVSTRGNYRFFEPPWVVPDVLEIHLKV